MLTVKKAKNMRCVLPALMILLFIMPVSGRSVSREIPEEGHPALLLRHRADSLYRIQQWEKAVRYYTTAEDRYLAARDTLRAWKCRYYRVMGYSNLQQTDSAFFYLQDAENIYIYAQLHPSIRTGFLFLQGYLAYKKKNYSQSVLKLSALLNNRNKNHYHILARRYLAYNYFQLGEFIRARDLMTEVLQQEAGSSGKTAERASDLHWMAILYTYFLGDPENGLRYLNLAKEEYEKAGAPPATFSKIYNELGTVSMKEGDYGKAREYYRMALNTLPEKKGYASVRANIYNNLGIINQKTGRYEEAESWFLKSISLKQKLEMSDIYRTYSNLGELYFNWKKNTKSKKFHRKAIENLIQQYGPQNWRVADSYQNFGRFLIINGQLDIGYQYLTKAMNLYKNQYGKKHPKIARCYLNYELYFTRTNQQDSALYYIQQSLKANAPDFLAGNIFSNPRPEKVLSREILLMALKDKAWVLEKLYEQKADTTYLYAALKTQEEAVALVRMIKKSFFNPQSRALLAAHEEETYLNAFRLAVKLYRITGDRQYLDKAFLFSEENRASGLLSAIRTNRAIYFAGIPDSVIKTESDLTTETGAYQELLYKEQNKPSPDREKIRKYEERIFGLQAQKDSLVRVLEKKYPRYYRLKYDLSTIPAEEAASRLGRDQALLEYEITGGQVYIFCLTDGRVHFVTRQAGSGLDKHIALLKQELIQKKFNNKATANYFDIIYSSYRLYDNLIRPVDSLIRHKHLIIVPDGNISGIPFDVLIKQIPKSEFPSYRKLPYLIYDHPVTYSYSTTLYFENRPGRRKFFNRVIAFAPEYPAGGMDLEQIMQVRQTDRYRLYPLPFARQEAENVCRETLGRLVEGREASETFFKAHTRRYDIIHLAMHTLIDDRHPLYSKLVFTQPPDSGEDGMLNTYEIYALQFRTNLAVLSACNSGSGKLSKGEGVVSLARSFRYAGVSRLVMSLWEINDRTGAIIMGRFYNNLVHGMTIDEALQQAKINYLENAGPLKSHPYFWAGYQMMGNAAAVYYPLYITLFIAIALITGIVLLIMRITRNHSRSR